MTSTAFSIRQATTADHRQLERLAQLDSQRIDGRDHFAVAEIDGAIVAAVSTTNGTVIADPFRRTTELVGLLRAHVGTAVVRQSRRHLSVRRPAMA
jgi:hypothetical protein